MNFLSPTVQKWMRRFIMLAVTLVAGAMFYEQTANHAVERQNEALKARIADARRVIAEIQEDEARVKLAREKLDALHQDSPPTPALVWFPGRVKQHFDRFGPSGAVARLNTALDEPALPGFERSYWVVEMPVGKSPAEVREICLAISELERLNASVRVVDVAIRPGENNPDTKLMVVNLTVLAPKKLRS